MKFGQKYLLISDDPSQNQNWLKEIINFFLTTNCGVKIIFFDLVYYRQLGFSCQWLSQKLEKKWQQLQLLNQTVVIIHGWELLPKPTWSWKLEKNCCLVVLANSLIHYQNPNYKLGFDRKWILNYHYYRPKLIITHKKSNFNRYYYHLITNNQGNNISFWKQKWNLVVEQLITTEVSYFDHKRIKPQILRLIIKTIALSKRGELQIMKFCQSNDLRYENVILGLNYLVKTGFLYEIKLVLANQSYSHKKQSLYFLAHNWIYLYYQNIFQLPPIITPLLISQTITDYFCQSNNHYQNLTYQFDSNNHDIMIINCDDQQIKINWNLQAHQQIVFNNQILKSIWHLDPYLFTNKTISQKQFLKPIVTLDQKPFFNQNVDINQYWVKFSLS